MNHSPKRATAIAGAAVATSLLAFAAPAQAAPAAQSIVRYQNGNCMGVDNGSIRTDQPIYMNACSGTKSEWRVTIIDDNFNGHPIARFQNVATGLCMDTLGHGRDQYVGTHACNPGDYQWFEVFTNSNGKRTFKSYAAYFEQGHQNLCLQDLGNGQAVRLETCTSAANQQFTRVGIS